MLVWPGQNTIALFPMFSKPLSTLPPAPAVGKQDHHRGQTQTMFNMSSAERRRLRRPVSLAS
jgi:hypothetical protein